MLHLKTRGLSFHSHWHGWSQLCFSRGTSQELACNYTFLNNVAHTQKNIFVFNDWINVKDLLLKRTPPQQKRCAWLFIVILTSPLTSPLQKSFFPLKRALCAVYSAFVKKSLLQVLFPLTEAPCLVKELPKGLVALPLVADFSCGDPAGAGADVRRAVLLARVI